MNDDFIESLGESGEQDPEEILEVKAFRKAFENFAKLATHSLKELDWDIVGQDDEMNGRPELIGLTSLINTFDNMSGGEENLWRLRIPRRFVTVMYDLLKMHVRDICWSDFSIHAGMTEGELEADHGLMVGLYGAVYHALGTTEAA